MKAWINAAVLLAATAAAHAGEPARDAEVQAGEALFKARCGICHQLPEPDALSPGKWRRVLDLMQKRMQQVEMSPLDETEYAQMMAYLTARAR